MAIGYWIPPFTQAIAMPQSNVSIHYLFLFFFSFWPPLSLFYSLSLYLTWFDSYICRPMYVVYRRSVMWCWWGPSQLSLLTLPSVASRFSSFSRFRNRYRIASFFFPPLSFLLPLFRHAKKRRTSFPLLLFSNQQPPRFDVTSIH